jgi:hypothetical protein
MHSSRSTLEARGRFAGSSVASLVNVTIRAALLPQKVVEFLQSHASTIANLMVEGGGDEARMEGVPNASEGNVHIVGPKEFWIKLDELLKAAGGEWQDVADSIWAFGPKRVGPNLLIDRTRQKRRRWVFLTDGLSRLHVANAFPVKFAITVGTAYSSPRRGQNRCGSRGTGRDARQHRHRRLADDGCGKYGSRSA